jgi:quinolinate synthase
LIDLQKIFLEAEIIAHPECKSVILKMDNFVGSTQAMLYYATNSDKNTFIVVTESGILHQMQKANPDKLFIPVPPEIEGKTCACNECEYMRMNTLEKLYDCLKNEKPEILVDKNIREKAVKPILKMLEMS